MEIFRLPLIVILLFLVTGSRTTRDAPKIVKCFRNVILIRQFEKKVLKVSRLKSRENADTLLVASLIPDQTKASEGRSCEVIIQPVNGS